MDDGKVGESGHPFELLSKSNLSESNEISSETIFA
jgi:hypothetical protein